METNAALILSQRNVPVLREIWYVSTVLSTLFFLLIAWQAHADLDSEVTTLFHRLQQGPVTPDQRLRAILSGKIFVLYPGHGGINPWVFQDNIRSLTEDFGIPRQNIILRDLEAQYRETHLSLEGMLHHEAQYLTSLCFERQCEPQSLVLVAHSSHGEELFGACLQLASELRAGGMISKVLFLETALYQPPGATEESWRLPSSISYLTVAARRKIFFEGYWHYAGSKIKHRSEGPGGIGTYIGTIAGDHVDTVMPVYQSPRSPYEFRQAVMRVIFSHLYLESN